MRIKGLLLVISAFFLFNICFVDRTYAYEENDDIVVNYNDNSYDDNYHYDSTEYNNDFNNKNNSFDIIFGLVFSLLFLLSFITPFIVFIAIIMNIFKKSRSRFSSNYEVFNTNNYYDYSNIKVNNKKREYNDVDINTLKSYLPNYELYTLKQKLLSVYKEIQNAWMGFDYPTLRKDCGDVLYNYYVSELEVLKWEKKKNIIKDIVVKDIKIFDIKKIYNSIYISVYLDASYYDYIVNNSNNSVTLGNANFRIENRFVLLFAYKEIDNTKWNCPNCGAVMGSTDKCDYCGTLLRDTKCEFILDKKINIRK